MKLVYIEVIDNNIYDPNFREDKSMNTTTWHFTNYNLIIPNYLGFDIHNYVDQEIYIDYDPSIRNKFLSSTIFLRDNKSIAATFTIDKKPLFRITYSKRFQKLSSNIELTKYNLIFHFYRHYRCKKPSRLVIPLEIANQFDEVDLYIDNAMKIAMFFRMLNNKNEKTLVLDAHNLVELNFADVDSCKKRFPASLENIMNFYNTYMNILLSRI